MTWQAKKEKKSVYQQVCVERKRKQIWQKVLLLFLIIFINDMTQVPKGEVTKLVQGNRLVKLELEPPCPLHNTTSWSLTLLFMLACPIIPGLQECGCVELHRPRSKPENMTLTLIVTGIFLLPLSLPPSLSFFLLDFGVCACLFCLLIRTKCSVVLVGEYAGTCLI